MVTSADKTYQLFIVKALADEEKANGSSRMIADNIALLTSASMVKAESPTNNEARIGCLVQKIADDGKRYFQYEKLRHQHRHNESC